MLVLAGDIDAKTAREKVERYFGDIPSGPPVSRQGPWIAKRTGSQRGTMQDRVPQARIYKVWNVPQWGSADATYLEMAASVLSAGKSSRLYKRLVYDEQIATDVDASVAQREIGGLFSVTASVRTGIEIVKSREGGRRGACALSGRGTDGRRAGAGQGSVERELHPGRRADRRLRRQIGRAGAGRGVRRPPRLLQGAAPARGGRHRGAGAIGRGALALRRRLHPRGPPLPRLQCGIGGADRSAPPPAGAPPAAEFPALERATLSNGLKVVLAERRSIPQVRFDLLLDAGYAADQFALPGTASLAMTMLDEGTTTRTALQISDRLADLGANLGAGSRLDVSMVSLSALRDQLDLVPRPLRRHRPSSRLPPVGRRPAQEAAAGADPAGEGRPGRPRPPSLPQARLRRGPRLCQSVERVRHRGLDPEHHPRRSRQVPPDLVQAQPRDARRGRGDHDGGDPAAPRAALRAAGQPGDVPAKNIGEVAERPRPSVYLFDRPGALQTVIIAGNIAPPKANPDEPAIETMSAVLGSDFGSRLNMNLREDKHWAYGSFSFIRDARGQRPFLAYAPVQTDKTTEAAAELLKELKGIIGDRPVQPDELERAKASLTLTLAGSWETMGALAGSIDDIIAFGLDDRYFDTYAETIRRQTAASVTAAARTAVRPDHLVWIFVGDREKIEAPLRRLGLGEIQLVDGDGQPVPTS